MRTSQRAYEGSHHVWWGGGGEGEDHEFEKSFVRNLFFQMRLLHEEEGEMECQGLDQGLQRASKGGDGRE